MLEPVDRSRAPTRFDNYVEIRDLLPFFETTPRDRQRLIGVDLDGVFYCTQAVVAVMRDNGRGVIVNISSIVAHIGLPDRTAYVAAKAGVLGRHAGAQA